MSPFVLNRVETQKEKKCDHVCDFLIKCESDNRPYVVVDVLGRKLVGLLDSGANSTVLGLHCLELVDRLDLKTHSINTCIRTADNSCHVISNFVYLPFNFQGVVKVIKTLLAPKINKELILGVDFWEQFNIKPSITSEVCCINIEEDCNSDIKGLTAQQSAQLQACKSEIQSVVEGHLTKTSVLTHYIDTGDNLPVKQRYYPTSPYVQKKIDKELDRMLNLGVIEPSNSPWSSPVVVVTKSNGNTRLCLDSRKLNERTKKDAYPLPYISSILGRFVGTKYLSAIDLKDAFWQVPLEETSKEKTAFTVPGRGLFQFTVMPFGLHNAPQTQCRLMDKVLGVDLQPYVFVYLDDILIATDSFEKHIEILKEVASRLKMANLSVNIDKSKFCVSEIKYLGYIVSTQGITTDPEKVNCVVNYPPPKTIREVRRFLGLASWYRRFINNFSTIVAPISELLKNKSKFVWTDDAEKAFVLLKNALVSAPILSNPDFRLPFTVQTDASDLGIGAVLTQEHSEGEKVVAYFSQKLTTCQRKYSATERECFAVLCAIEKFRPYIEGVHFDVITDHASLVWLKNLKDPTGRLSRWALRMQQFDFTLTHRKGKLNVVPDALSRILINDENCLIDLGENSNWYESLKKKLSENSSFDPAFRMENNQIFKHIKYKGGSTWKMVVPESKQKDILMVCHDHSAHLGFFKTYRRISEKMYWPNLYRDVKAYIKNCDVCKASKTVTKSVQPPIGRPKVAEVPWEIISLDYIGPLPRSKKGNTVLLVIADWFSKWVTLLPMRSADSSNTCKLLEENIFLNFGVPRVIVSDNGKQFTSNLFKDLLNNYGVKHWFNAVYHPQNNPTERVNKVIGAALRSYVGVDHRDWDLAIPKIACSLRTAVHESSKYSPYYINFGRNMISHAEDYELPEFVRGCDFPEPRFSELGKVREIVKINLGKAYEKYGRNYNLRSKNITYSVGDFVWRRNFILSDAEKNICAKLAPKYIKCRVLEKNGQNTYKLADLNSKKVAIYHCKDLKPN